MVVCPDCSNEITATEVTASDGRKFITMHDADMAAQMYRPERGYSVATVTGRNCGNRENHGG